MLAIIIDNETMQVTWQHYYSIKSWREGWVASSSLGLPFSLETW